MFIPLETITESAYDLSLVDAQSKTKVELMPMGFIVYCVDDQQDSTHDFLMP